MARVEKLLVLTLLVFLPSQLGFHWWPDWSLMDGVRVDYLSPTLYFTDLLIFLLLAFAFFKRYIKIPKIFYFIFLAALVNIYFSLSPAVSVLHWIRFLELFLVGLYFFSRSHVLRPVITAGLVVALLWTSGLAIWQFTSQHSIGGPWYFLGERNFSVSTPGIAKLDLGNYGYWLRPYSTLPHPNALAGFLLVGTMLVFYFAPRHTKQLLWLCVPVGVAIFLSWSRAAIAAILALIAFPLLPLAFFLPGNPTSFAERWSLSLSAWHSIQEKPWTGVGLGNFINYLQGTSFQPVHNIFLLILSELGVVMFGVAVVYLIKVLLDLLALRQWLLLKILLIVLGLGLVDHYWLTLHQTSLLLAILLAQTEVLAQTSVLAQTAVKSKTA